MYLLEAAVAVDVLETLDRVVEAEEVRVNGEVKAVDLRNGLDDCVVGTGGADIAVVWIGGSEAG